MTKPAWLACLVLLTFSGGASTLSFVTHGMTVSEVASWLVDEYRCGTP